MSFTPPTHEKHNLKAEALPHWYALRTTYGRERKAYDYLTAKGIKAYCPTKSTVKLEDGKRKIVEQSRLPNIFFAYGTEEELKKFVYDNVNLPFLRFYYRHFHSSSNKMDKVPMIVPDRQIDSLMIICKVEEEDVIFSTEEIRKFRKGQLVRVKEGKFAGVTGRVTRFKGQQRVGIYIEGLLTMATAYVPNCYLEPVAETAEGTASRQKQQ